MPHSPTLQIEARLLFDCLVTVRRGTIQRAEVWLGVLETVYGIHITTAGVIDSNVTHVFLQQFKWSPRVNRTGRDDPREKNTL